MWCSSCTWRERRVDSALSSRGVNIVADDKELSRETNKRNKLECNCKLSNICNGSKHKINRYIHIVLIYPCCCRQERLTWSASGMHSCLPPPPLILVILLADPLSWLEAKETSLLSTSVIPRSAVIS